MSVGGRLISKRNAWVIIILSFAHYAATLALFVHTMGPLIAQGEMLTPTPLPAHIQLQSKILGALLLPASPLLIPIFAWLGGNGAVWPVLFFALPLNSGLAILLVAAAMTALRQRRAAKERSE